MVVSTIKILSKEELDALKRPNDIKASFDLFVRVVGELFLLFWMIHFIESSEWLWVGLLFVTVATWHSFWGYAGLSHELFHGKVFTSKFVNKAILLLANALTWTNGVFFKSSHTLHHAKTFDEKDNEALSVQVWSFGAIFRYLFIDYKMLWNRFSYVVKNAMGSIPTGLLNDVEMKNVQKVALWILGFNVLLQFAVFMVFENLIVNILLFLIPFSGQLLNRMLAQSQHIGLASRKEDGVLLNSRSIQLPYILELLYAGMNYHCEHHLYPTVPYYNLSKIHEKIINQKLEANFVDFSFLFNEFWKFVK